VANNLVQGEAKISQKQMKAPAARRSAAGTLQS
jgi:hypothetical protein